MRRRLLPFVLFPLVTGTAACGLAKLDPEVDTFSRELVKLAEAGDSAALVDRLDPGLTSSTSWLSMAELTDSLRQWRPDTLELIGYNVVEGPDEYHARVTYEMHGAESWGLAEVVLSRRGGALRATGVHIQRTNGSLRAQNDFVLGGRGGKHYLVLVAAVLVAAFTIGVALLMLLTPMPRRGWWALGALLGFAQVGINWTTGESFVNPLRVQLLGAGYVREGMVGPWIIFFSIPVGALWALRHRHHQLRKPAAAAP